MKRILVLGGTGMLGHKLVQVLSHAGEFDVHATVRSEPSELFRAPGTTYHTGVDLGHGSGPLGRVLQDVDPDVVVNAIGAIKQKDLHSAIDGTFYINASLPHLVPLLAPRPETKVIHFSTDCVYRGDRGQYTEQDAPDAVDLYGRSKACGEIGYAQHLTLRTSIVGFELAGHLGLFSWLLKQPRGSRLRGFRRAIYSGLPTVTLSRTVRHILLGQADLTGLYHVASEPIDKYDLLSRLNDALELGHNLEPDDQFVIDRSLDDTTFRNVTSTIRPNWDSLIAELVEDYQTLPYDQVYATSVDRT